MILSFKILTNITENNITINTIHLDTLIFSSTISFKIGIRSLFSVKTKNRLKKKKKKERHTGNTFLSDVFPTPFPPSILTVNLNG